MDNPSGWIAISFIYGALFIGIVFINIHYKKQEKKYKQYLSTLTPEELEQELKKNEIEEWDRRQW